jgi:AcrR family transcriptional regulator
MLAPSSRAENAPGPEESALLDTLPPSRRLHRLLRDFDTLVTQEGFLHLTTGQIAVRLRCSKASLYRMAPGLEDLFELVVRYRFALVFDAVGHRRASGGSWTERLISSLDSLVSEQSKLSYEYMRDLFAFPPTASLVKAYRARGERDVRVILEAGIEAGEFHSVNAGLAAHILQMTVSRICEPDFLVSTGLPSADGLAEALRIFEVGIIRRPARAKGQSTAAAVRSRPTP